MRDDVSCRRVCSASWPRPSAPCGHGPASRPFRCPAAGRPACTSTSRRRPADRPARPRASSSSAVNLRCSVRMYDHLSAAVQMRMRTTRAASAAVIEAGRSTLHVMIPTPVSSAAAPPMNCALGEGDRRHSSGDSHRVPFSPALSDVSDHVPDEPGDVIGIGPVFSVEFDDLITENLALPLGFVQPEVPVGVSRDVFREVVAELPIHAVRETSPRGRRSMCRGTPPPVSGLSACLQMTPFEAVPYTEGEPRPPGTAARATAADQMLCHEATVRPEQREGADASGRPCACPVAEGHPGRCGPARTRGPAGSGWKNFQARSSRLLS